MKTRSKKSLFGLFGHVPWGLSRLKTGPRNGKKMINNVKGLISQMRRDFEETFTANFAQSGENNVDPFFKHSDICIFIVSI